MKVPITVYVTPSLTAVAVPLNCELARAVPAERLTAFTDTCGVVLDTVTVTSVSTVWYSVVSLGIKVTPIEYLPGGPSTEPTKLVSV